MSLQLFLIASNNKKVIHAGLTKNINKAVQFYKSMPGGEDYHRLVYIEIWSNESEAKERFELVTRLNKEQKEDLIKSQNPEMIELQPGINIEL